MNALRLVYYVIDPYTDERTLIAALIRQAGAIQVLRAPAPRLAPAARANVERILRDLEATHVLDPLPFGVGAQVVAGPVILLPATLTDAQAWVREVLLRSAA